MHHPPRWLTLGLLIPFSIYSFAVMATLASARRD